jgi:rusticyanin
MGNMNGADASLGEFIGRQAGTALAGDAPIAVDSAQLATMGNDVPAGADVVACANRVVFSATSVAFVIEAAPPNNPDMTFRLAGLVNPTVVVPQNAQVSIEFVNSDTDEAHAFVITAIGPPYSLRPAATPAFPGAVAGPIGDATSAGHGARVLSFSAVRPGTYHYLCPMPGHAEMGMTCLFVVQ